MRARIDITGKRFGRLKVIEEDGRDKRGEIRWKCVCDCGEEKTLNSSTLRTGNSKSCGCYRKELGKRKNLSHGGAKVGKHDRLYCVWNDMKQRTTNPKNTSYKYYGAEGVTVCDEWMESYEAFRAWSIANGYNPKAPRGECTLDRIDPHGNYCPENCRWADMRTQNKNKRKKEAV